MSDISRKEKVNRLPTLVSEMGEKKFLGIPKLDNGKGKTVT